MFEAGEVSIVRFPGAQETKRRPAVVLSSPVYHANQPDIIVGLITSQRIAAGPTDYALQDWSAASLRVPCTFRAYLVTLPPDTNPIKVRTLTARDWEAVQTCVRAALTF